MRHRNAESVASNMGNADQIAAELGNDNQDIKDAWYTDTISMGILLVLYTLQGIPMGLSGSIPLLMKEKGVSYEGLSLFSLVSLPFSFKLIWAPIVDSLFIKRIGRRKTWLVPVQILCGFIMIFATSLVNEWMGENTNMKNNKNGILNVEGLTAFFMFLYLLMATQDIAVDGWALTMLSRRNVGYASICNTIGQAFGVFLANQGLISLSDSKWCHTYLGMEAGKTLVTLSGFMRFWGIIFIITTVYIWLFKSEAPIPEGEEPDGLIATYRQVIAIFKSKPVQMLCLILLTRKIAAAPIDAVSIFKMQEYGMPKSDIATISPIIMIIQFLLPALMSSYAASRPLNLVVYGCALQIPATIVSWAVVQIVPSVYANGQSPTMSFFVYLIAASVFHQLTNTMVFIGMMSFFAKISDPSIGGTYMTLLNTVANLGSLWTSSASLWIIPKLSTSTCLSITTKLPIILDNSTTTGSAVCTAASTEFCKLSGGVCAEDRDSFTILVTTCLVLGVVWLIAFSKIAFSLQDRPHEDWWVSSTWLKAKKTSASETETTLKSS